MKSTFYRCGPLCGRVNAYYFDQSKLINHDQMTIIVLYF